METLFAQYRPAVVIHAAAHKHVPMMELQPVEAIKNNVLGTRQMATLADRYGARLMVDEAIDQEVRDRIKNLEEGSQAWDVEYAKTIELLRRSRGLI